MKTLLSHRFDIHTIRCTDLIVDTTHGFQGGAEEFFALLAQCGYAPFWMPA